MAGIHDMVLLESTLLVIYRRASQNLECDRITWESSFAKGMKQAGEKAAVEASG
jgi:hypothetical protein